VGLVTSGRIELERLTRQRPAVQRLEGGGPRAEHLLERASMHALGGVARGTEGGALREHEAQVVADDERRDVRQRA
jgi:hypothetical protein